MNFRVFHVVLALLVVGIVGVLIRQHANPVADGMCTFVLQADSTAIFTGVIVVEVVLQCQVLIVVALATILKNCRAADAFQLLVGSIADDGTLHTLTDQGHPVARNTSQRFLPQVVVAVGYHDKQPLRVFVTISLIRLINGVQKTLGVTGFYDYHLLGST